MKPNYRDGWEVSKTDYMPQCSECGAKMDGNNCATCEVAKYHNLEDDDTPCLNCDEVTL